MKAGMIINEGWRTAEAVTTEQKDIEAHDVIVNWYSKYIKESVRPTKSVFRYWGENPTKIGTITDDKTHVDAIKMAVELRPDLLLNYWNK